jgi:UDP-N-acetylenolpyruvoylglucosamine reductase
MASLNSQTKDLSSFWKGEILWDEPMSQYSTFKVGGPAEAIISVTSIEDLKRLIHWLKKNDISWRIVGRGSNILVPDDGLAGVTIVLDGQFVDIEKVETQPGQKEDSTLIRSGGGCLLSKLVHYCTAIYYPNSYTIVPPILYQAWSLLLASREVSVGQLL